MQIPDLNVLLYAVNPQSADHGPARRWLDEALSGGDTVGFVWLVLIGFIRIATNPGVFPAPMAASDAVTVVDEWLGAPGAVTVEPTRRHLHVLRELLTRSGTAGNLTNDAHLAAIALEHRAAVCTFDRDLTRFAGLEIVTPR